MVVLDLHADVDLVADAQRTTPSERMTMVSRVVPSCWKLRPVKMPAIPLWWGWVAVLMVVPESTLSRDWWAASGASSLLRV